MSFKLGNTNISELYVGNSKIAQAYLGYSLVYQQTAPGPTDEVTIGTQTWKNVNLAVDDGQGGIYTQVVNYGQGDVTEYYYTYAAAVRVANTVTGWHLPSQAEFETLVLYCGGTSVAGGKLKSTFGWNEYNGQSGGGTDDYGFTGFPAGSRNNSGSYLVKGYLAYYWSSTLDGTGNRAYYLSLSYSTTQSSIGVRNLPNCHTVRLIKDT